MAFVTTERLILREVDARDEADFFEMDSDPQVHRYLLNTPVQTVTEVQTVIALLQEQYRTNGIARWAVVERSSGECIGWSGLKFFREPVNDHINFYELGYRFKTKHWGKGYATEAARAVLDYGFTNLPIESIYALTHPDNVNSKKVLAKLGFQIKGSVEYFGPCTDWHELKKEDWQNQTAMG